MDKKKETLSSPLNYSAFLILLSLRQKSHGYEIMKYVNETTHGMISIGPATMYRTIADFLEKKYIELISEDDSRKEYLITEKGQNILNQQIYFIQLLNELALEGGTDDEKN